jgi:CheY-like chemotaxis protein
LPPARTDERTAAERELLRGLRVLLVEDHKVNQLIGKQMLARAGCGEVVVAANGEQGVQAWEQQGPFHLVLMDYHVRLPSISPTMMTMMVHLLWTDHPQHRLLRP